MAFLNSTKAIISHSPKNGEIDWKLSSVKLRDVGQNEVLVRVVASGLCHSDIHLSLLPPEHARYPTVLGHEGAGVVVKVGGGVTHVKPGDKVLLSFDYCGEESCYNCEAETPGYCPKFLEKNLDTIEGSYEFDGDKTAAGGFFGQSSFGGLAIAQRKSVINVEDLVKDEEELKLFAPFGCGIQTGAGSVTELADVSSKDAVVVVGIGGVGMGAVMAANIRGARTIIAIDRVQSRLDTAKAIGATHTINTTSFVDLKVDIAKAIQDVEPKGPNVVIDTTGVVPIVETSLEVLHQRGQLVLIGIMAGKTLPLDLSTLLGGGKSIRGCIEGSAKPSKYIPQLIKWHREGKLPIEKLVKSYPAHEFKQAVEDMLDGTTIKPVLVW